MRELTKYEKSRIKDAMYLSKKFSDKDTRKKIKRLLKVPLTTDTASSIFDFLKRMLEQQTNNALDYSSCLYDLDYAQCTIIAIRHLNRAVHSQKESME